MQSFSLQTVEMVLEDVCYYVKVKGKEKQLLENVGACFKPGELIAIMGRSGAGKKKKKSP